MAVEFALNRSCVFKVDLAIVGCSQYAFIQTVEWFVCGEEAV